MRGLVSDERRIPTRADRTLQASGQTRGPLHRKAIAGSGGRIRRPPLRIGKGPSSVAGIAASEAGRAEPRLIAARVGSAAPSFRKGRNVVGKTRAKHAARSRSLVCCSNSKSEAVVEDERASHTIV